MQSVMERVVSLKDDLIDAAPPLPDEEVQVVKVSPINEMLVELTEGEAEMERAAPSDDAAQFVYLLPEHFTTSEPVAREIPP